MNHLLRKHTWYFFPWAVAALMLSIGSLVNFHQYRIWHQPLLPKLVAYKKDLEHTQTDLVLAKINFDKDLTRLQPTAQSAILPGSFELGPGSTYTLYVDILFTANHFPSVQSPGLRAPPLS